MKVGDQIIANNDKYFEDIFNKYYPGLCIFAGRLINDKDVAKDLIQEVFIKVWNSDAELENEKALQAYLYVSAKNTCLTYLRKTKNIDSLDTEKISLPSEKNVLNEILRQETYRLLEDAINELGEQSQKIIRLSLFGYGNNEIAQELQVSINTIKTLKLRAYKRLRKNVGSQAITLLLAQFIDVLA